MTTAYHLISKLIEATRQLEQHIRRLRKGSFFSDVVKKSIFMFSAITLSYEQFIQCVLYTIAYL